MVSALLEQAQHNLDRRGQMESIVIDRGYLDGADLWQVRQQGVTFVVTSKAGMAVTAVRKRWPKRSGSRCASRWCVMAKGPQRSRLLTELVGIEALTSYDAYGDPEQTQAAVIVHCHFTLLVLAPRTAFRLWQAEVEN